MYKKNIGTLLLLAASHMVYAAGQSPSPLELQRSSAAGYAVTTTMAIGTIAEDCRSTLAESDAYKKAIESDWALRNNDYAVAGERWISIVIANIKRTDGEDAARRARNIVLSGLHQSAVAMETNIIGSTQDNRQLRCQFFATEARAGKYDITPASAQYQHLQELVSYLKTHNLLRYEPIP